MLAELQAIVKTSATIKRTKDGDPKSAGVSVTVAGNGRLDKVRIDDDLSGDLATIEKLVVEGYLAAREAAFHNSRANASERLRRQKEAAATTPASDSQS